jgi:hypothetical protein
MREMGHAKCMGEIRNMDNFLIGRPQEKRLVGRLVLDMRKI